MYSQVKAYPGYINVSGPFMYHLSVQLGMKDKADGSYDHIKDFYNRAEILTQLKPKEEMSQQYCKQSSFNHFYRGEVQLCPVYILEGKEEDA